MKTTNRILSFLLVLLLAFSLALTASAAEADVRVTAAADKEAYTSGETAYVTFTQNGEAADVPGWDLSVYYDPAQATWIPEESVNGTGVSGITYVEKTLKDGTKVVQLGGLELDETFTVASGEVSRLAFRTLEPGEITLRCEYTFLDAEYAESAKASIDETVMLKVNAPVLTIVTQPENVSAPEGEKASVTVEASGEDLTYTWYYKNPGSDKFLKTSSFTGNTYSVKMTEARSGRQVYCVITDKYGQTVTTETATLSLELPQLVILTQPEDVCVASGEKAVVTVEAQGEELTYAWYYKNAGSKKFSLTSAFTGNSYSVSMTEARSGRQVYCVITDKHGQTVTTETVTLSLAVTPLEIVTQPEDVTVPSGEKLTVTVEATGDGLTYAWYYKNANSAKFVKTTAFTGNTYSLTMTAERSGRQIYCIITDKYGASVTTDTVVLSMAAAVEIVGQPEDVAVGYGEKAAATVEAVGDGLSYTWYYKNAGASEFVKSTGVTGNTYSVTMNASRSGRQVYCIITDIYGNSVKSDTVTLSMTAELEIITQPEDVTVASGKTAKVTVEAIGEGLTYQWYYKNADDSEFTLTTAFTGSTYSLKMTAARDGRQVYCVITDAYGNTATSDTVTLTMK